MQKSLQFTVNSVLCKFTILYGEIFTHSLTLTHSLILTHSLLCAIFGFKTIVQVICLSQAVALWSYTFRQRIVKCSIVELVEKCKILLTMLCVRGLVLFPTVSPFDSCPINLL